MDQRRPRRRPGGRRHPGHAAPAAVLPGAPGRRGSAWPPRWAWPPRAPGRWAQGVTAPPAAADSVRDGQQGVLAMLNVPAAWATSRGQGVTVAVLDSGVQPAVSDLSGGGPLVRT